MKPGEIMWRIYPDWQTKPEHSFADVPELTTHACLETLRSLEPDVVIPPSSNGERFTFKEVARGEWPSIIDQVIRSLS
jgi:hypothetical protein